MSAFQPVVAGWIGWAMAGEALIAIALAAFLAWRGFRTLATWSTVVIIGGFGILVGLNASTYVVGPYSFTLSVIASGLFAAAAAAELAFAATFAGGIREPWRSRLVGLSAIPLLLWLVVVVLYLLGPGGGWIPSSRAFGVVVQWALLAATLILAIRFWLERSTARRRQLLYGFVPFLVWFANHTVFWEPSLPPGRDLASTVALTTNIVRIAVYAVIVLLAAASLLRRAENWTQDAVVLAWAVAAAPLSLLQRIAFGLHELVDGLFIVALFYGVARYQILQVDMDWRTPVGRGVLGAFAVPVFFITQQVIEQAAGATLGALAGAVAAGLGLSLLYLVGDRIKTLAGATATPDDHMSTYLAHRRMEIYRAAVEASLVDGLVDARESRSLAALRSELGITLSEHDALRRDLAARRHAPAPTD